MIYQYRCTNGHEFDRYLPLSKYDEPQTCECGAKAKKIITASRMVMPDFEPFMDTTGKYIGGRASWREHLKRHDAIEMGRTDFAYQQQQEEKKRRNIGKDPERKQRLIAEFEKRRL